MDTPIHTKSHPHLRAAALLTKLITESPKKISQVASETGISRIALYDLCRCTRLFKAEHIGPLARVLDFNTETVSQLQELAVECASSDESPLQVSATPEMMELGRILRQERKKTGKTLKDFAAELSFYAPNYGGYERGTRRMSLATAGRIIRHLHFSEELAKRFLNLVALTRKAQQTQPDDTATLVKFELSRQGIALQEGDQIKSVLSPESFAKLKAVLPQLQQRLADKLVKLGFTSAAQITPEITQTPISAVIEHADGRTTFVMIELLQV